MFRGICWKFGVCLYWIICVIYCWIDYGVVWVLIGFRVGWENWGNGVFFWDCGWYEEFYVMDWVVNVWCGELFMVVWCGYDFGLVIFEGRYYYFYLVELFSWVVWNLLWWYGDCDWIWRWGIWYSYSCVGGRYDVFDGRCVGIFCYYVMFG